MTITVGHDPILLGDANLVFHSFPDEQRGFDDAGNLDQGLVFSAFQQDPVRQFAAIQQRLSGESLVDYITAVAGGYYFVPPGTGGPSGWLDAQLFV